MLVVRKGKYKLEDLHIGMQVTVSDLCNIYDTYLLLTGITNINLDEIGTLVWFGSKLTNEARELINNGAECLYFDKDEITGLVTFE